MLEEIKQKKEILVVAEVGNNHEGDFDVARQLVEEAANCGVDAVKFQTFVTEQFVGKQNEERYRQLKSYELSREQFEKLQKLTHELDLLFMSTPLDLESQAFLEPLVDCFKIASGDNTFYPLLEKVATSDKPLILSTGLAKEDELNRSIEFIKKHRHESRKTQPIGILHCVSAYPVSPDNANLRSIEQLQESFPDEVIGYSDHTLGLDAATFAVGMGANIVEKHFTLDHNFSDFRDHRLSADPAEMKQLVSSLQKATDMLGSKEIAVQPQEEGGIQSYRRSIAAAKPLEKGHQLEEEDFIWIRPASGIPPGQEQELVGKTLKTEKSFSEIILPEDVE